MFDDAFTVFPVLLTDRLTLRRLEDRDAGPLSSLMDDPEWMEFTDYPVDFDFAKAIPLFNNEAYNAKVMLRFCIALKTDDGCVGNVYLFFPHGDDDSGRRMEIGYEIIPAFRNMGYAREAIGRVVRYGFEQMGLVRIEALIMAGNAASMRVCEGAGFVREGVLRSYRHYMHRGGGLRDMVVYSVLAGDVG